MGKGMQGPRMTRHSISAALPCFARCRWTPSSCATRCVDGALGCGLQGSTLNGDAGCWALSIPCLFHVALASQRYAKKHNVVTKA
jgi:hypothetical protein